MPCEPPVMLRPSGSFRSLGLSLDVRIDLKIVSDRIGHANVPATAQIYGHRSTRPNGPAAEKMAALFLNFLEPDQGLS
jgi:integrase